MNRLSAWWRRVFGEAAPMDHSSMTADERAVEVPPDRMAVIEGLKARQHAQANEITAETGRAYITRRRAQQAEAIRREREFWQRNPPRHPPAGDHHRA